MTDTRVPAFPHVLIIVTDAAVMVDGVVVDRGSAGDPDTSVAILLGTHAAARRVAQRLGRPVRATLRCKGEEKRIIVQPDGSYSDAEETKPARSLVVKVAAPGAPAAPIRRPARRSIRAVVLVDKKRLGTSAAYVALGTVLISGLLLTGSDGEEPAQVADGALEAPSGRISSEDVILGGELDRLPGLSEVVAAAGAGSFQLRVTTGRAARVKVLASPLVGDGPARVWTIQTTGATTRTVAVDGVEAGAYRWVVRTSGEPARTGNVMVEPEPEPEPPADTDDEVTQTDTNPDTSSPPPSDNDEGDDEGSSLPGPTGPVDPDDPTGP